MTPKLENIHRGLPSTLLTNVWNRLALFLGFEFANQIPLVIEE